MSNPRQVIVIIATIMLAFLVCAGLTWFNYQFTTRYTGGREFLPGWLGTRLFLFEGQSPYSAATDQAVRQALSELSEVQNYQDAFLYPFYGIILFAPFALIEEMPLALALWMSTLELALAWLAVIGWRLIGWRVNTWMGGILILFGLTWYYGAQVVIQGDPAGVVALIICLALLAIRRNEDGLAGVLLVGATIEPQVMILLLGWVLIWALSQRRYTILIVFAGSIALLVAAFMLFEVDWVLQNFIQVIADKPPNLNDTPVEILADWLPGVGRQLGWGLTIFFGSLLLVEWRQAQKNSFNWFLWVAYLSLVANAVIGIPNSYQNLIVLFPALILIISAWAERWRWGGWILISFLLIGLHLGIWASIGYRGETFWQAQPPPLFYLLLPLLLALLLYWIRWWATKPPLLGVERLRKHLGM